MAAAKKAANKVETMVEDAQKAATEGFEKMNKASEDAMAFAQDNMAAYVKASETVAKAAEAMNAEIVAFAKKSVEEGVAASKELSEVKSIPDFVERQSAMMKTVFDGYVSEATKLNEMATAAMEDATERRNASFQAERENMRQHQLINAELSGLRTRSDMLEAEVDDLRRQLQDSKAADVRSQIHHHCASSSTRPSNERDS